MISNDLDSLAGGLEMLINNGRLTARHVQMAIEQMRVLATCTRNMERYGMPVLEQPVPGAPGYENVVCITDGIPIRGRSRSVAEDG